MRAPLRVYHCTIWNLESIITFGYTGASPALMGACAKRNISLCFLTVGGRFSARVVGKSHGNVLLRREQYRLCDCEDRSCEIAKNFITGKIYNAKWILERAIRDHAMRIDVERIKNVSAMLSEKLENTRNCTNLEQIRGVEGSAASLYFGELDSLILQQKEDFFFCERNRRPPTDNVNALLSFVYTLLANDCASALETVGLDAYAGFLHRDRPGRISLALDLMEEFRGLFADRFVITLINKREVNKTGFSKRENGSVAMKDDTRKIVLTAWQDRKRDLIVHPYLKEKVEWGLVPYVQRCCWLGICVVIWTGIRRFYGSEVYVLLVLITYDVNTQSAEGRKRLHKVAKQCENFGHRVQNSVFECVLDAAKCREVKHVLTGIIDDTKDSLRFYYLGNNYKSKVDHIGIKVSFDVEGSLIL